MNITVLGCWGAYPQAGEATSGYLLQTERAQILIDCGSGVLAQLFKHISIEQLDAVILSHYHHDHVADVGCLQYAALISTQLGKRNTPLPIYGHRQSDRFQALTYGTFTEGREIKQGQTLELSGLKIDFQKTVHPEFNLAMKFEYDGKTLVYTGDTGNTEELIPFMKDSNLLICESSLYDGQQGEIIGHLTASEAGRLARQAQVQKLVLTHFPHYGKVTDLKIQAAQQYGGPVEMAKGGKVFTV